ncbi:MAG: NAD-dependent dehydratase [Firmicutes bacterium HGW-Firmicutes-15]|nr:MAG: NAD-dependent dehydratase [Firmicutes bacterium HGW-Firmicutes-15]
MKVIVTGGAGFIGSHLVDRLLADGHKVTVLDNFSTGRPENLKHQENEKRLRLIEVDIQNRRAIQEYFKGVDWVFHLAALADIVPSIEKPEEYFHSNVDGTLAILEAVRQNGGVKKFLYAASSSCYGIPDVYPTPETAEIKPQYPYALTKNLSEQMLMHWGRLYKIPVIALRLFNVYGPRSRTSGTYGAVFGVFLAQKLAGKPFTVVGDGIQTRDFTYVSDIADVFVCAAESHVKNEIFNVGSGGTYSVNQLVNLLGGTVKYIPKRPGEPDCTFADTTKINKMLGWYPRVSLAEGVARVLENIEYWREAPVWTPETIRNATENWFKYLGD